MIDKAYRRNRLFPALCLISRLDETCAVTTRGKHASLIESLHAALLVDARLVL